MMLAIQIRTKIQIQRQIQTQIQIHYFGGGGGNKDGLCEVVFLSIGRGCGLKSLKKIKNIILKLTRCDVKSIWAMEIEKE